MSRIGKQPVTIPDGVTVTLEEASIEVKGPKGTLSAALPPSVEARIEDGQVVFKPLAKDKPTRSLYGLVRALTNNMVMGVTNGFAKDLEILGVGYRADVKGRVLNLTLGFSHPVEVPVPEGLDVKMDGNTKIRIEGIDKHQVGQFASEIRKIRPPEPYKGKGVRYADEHVRRKVGKTGAK